MILSKVFYDNCGPSYKNIIDQLEKKIDEIYVSDENIKIKVENIYSTILDYSANYLLPKDYWVNCIQVIRFSYPPSLENSSIIEGMRYKIAETAYFHLNYNNDSFSHLYKRKNNDYNLKLLDFQKIQDHDFDEYIACEQDIAFPHNYIKECFRQFESQTTCLPSRKLIERYEKMKELYPKIMAVEDDIEKWFKLLLEVDDVDFVMDNVESQLGDNLLNIQLWNLYLTFLKEQKQYKRLLGIYSKYCRFFLDDHEMKEEYKEAIKKYGSIKLLWKNLFDFESYNDNPDNVDETMDVEDRAQSTELKFFYNYASFFDTYKFQDFALSGPIIRYILNNANHRTLRKLFFSCKYFYPKKFTPICYQLKTGSMEAFKNESLTLQFSSNQDIFVKNTFVTGSIHIKNYGNAEKTFLSKLIPRLYRCEARFIELCVQDFSFNELKFLIEHGGVVYLDIYESNIKDKNNEFIDLERITKYLPNIEKLSLSNVKTNANTGHALAEQKFNGKIFDFYINSIYGKPFDANEFIKYCDANHDEYFNLVLQFNENFDAAFVESFKEIIEDYENTSLKFNCSIEVL